MSDRDDGGPAFPLPLGEQNISPAVGGMSLRDYFATAMSADEIGATVYHSLSRAAQESLIGRSHPTEPPVKALPEILMAYQLQKMQFAIDVSARIRFMHADAMLKARKS